MRYFNKFSSWQTYYFAVLLTVAIIFTLYAYFTPYALDDYMFRNRYIYYNNGETTFSFKALIDFANEVRVNDNGRLANILCGLIVTSFPHWLFSVLSGIGFAYLYWLIITLSKINNRQKAPVLVLAVAASIVLLPFRNHIIVCDYLLNYLYPSIFILSFILILKRVEDKALTWLPFIGALLLGACAGWFHEGFSVPVCVGLGVYAIYKRFHLSPQWWILVIIFGLISLWTALAPGIWQRVSRELNGHDSIEKIKDVVFVLPVVFIAVIWVLITFLKKTLKLITAKIFKRQEIIVAFTAACVNAIMVLCLASDSRAGWPGELFSFIVLLAYVPYLKFIRAGRLLYISSIIVYLLLCVFFVNVLIWQKRFYDESKKIEAMLYESESGTIFYDIMNPRSTRLSTLFLVTRDLWVQSFHFFTMSDDIRVKNKQFVVVPKALENFNLSKAKKIEGSADLWTYNGYIVGKEAQYKNKDLGWFGDECSYDIITEDGALLKNQICFRTSFSLPDGKRYMYVYPYVPIYGQIKAINLPTPG